MAKEPKKNRTEQPEIVQPETPVAQDANEVTEQPNERWWENRGPSGEVH